MKLVGGHAWLAIRNETFPAERSVFYDLGFDEAETRVLEMRADLIPALREHIAFSDGAGRQPSRSPDLSGASHSRATIFD